MVSMYLSDVQVSGALLKIIMLLHNTFESMLCGYILTRHRNIINMII